MRILYISEYRETGGGYSAICEGMTLGLTKLGHEVKILAINNSGMEHPLPCSVIPVMAPVTLGEQARVIIEDWIPDAVVVALDLPHHADIMPTLKAYGGFRYIGIFPVEGAPLLGKWIEVINQMDGRLTLSRFGVETCAVEGCDVRLLPLTSTPGIALAKSEDREKMRRFIKIENRFVVLKVADNTTRKNWWHTITYFARWCSPEDVLYAVTRPDNIYGWDFYELAEQVGAVHLPGTTVWEWRNGAQIRILKNLRRLDLAWLLNVSDCLLQDSGNEGLCMPILESFQARLPVVGMRHTAITELLEDGRGILFPNGYEYGDPFGNVRRYYPEESSWGSTLSSVKTMPETDREQMVARAKDWLGQRSWEKAAQALVDEVNR